MFSARSLISSSGTAYRIIRTYVNYPTNRHSSLTPLSSFLRRCALSTTPEIISDTSGSHSTKKLTMKVGDNPINSLPDMSSVIQASSSADLVTSVSAKSSLYKPMDRDKKMADLEDRIKKKDAVLMRLAEGIASATNMRDVLLEKEV